MQKGNGSISVRLGDFGLATTRRQKKDDPTDRSHHDTKSINDDAINNIESGEMAATPHHLHDPWSEMESMTEGVGTTFYRAPEQEGSTFGNSYSYTVQADIFSLGIILFEMFHPPFGTYMERAEILTRLRGGHQLHHFTMENNWTDLAQSRFPQSFTLSAPENAQRYVRNVSRV